MFDADARPFSRPLAQPLTRDLARRAARLGLALSLVAGLTACGSLPSLNGFGSSGAYPGSVERVPSHATSPQPETYAGVQPVAQVQPVQPMQSLQAPAQPATAPLERFHTVAKGDTLYNISKRYGVQVADLQSANGMGASNALSLGQRLKLSGGATAASAPASTAALARRSFALDPQKAQAAAAALGPQRIKRPVPGEILRGWGEGVGRRKNAGVDLAANAGDPVGSAADGKVAFVSDPTSPVGAVVLVEHAGGMTTIYGRLARITVKPGQKVTAGQTIAHVAQRLGDRSALHFEIRYGSEPVNPTPFL